MKKIIGLFPAFGLVGIGLVACGWAISQTAPTPADDVGTSIACSYNNSAYTCSGTTKDLVVCGYCPANHGDGIGCNQNTRKANDCCFDDPCQDS